MSEGYYFSNHKVYYGSYEESQVSGFGMVTPEKMKEYGFSECTENQKVVRFYPNHRILDAEYRDFESALKTMKGFQNINTNPVNFSEVEARLGVEFPRELKLLYTAINGYEEYFSTEIHFLPFDEIYIDQGIIVVCKKKRTPISGIDIITGCQASYVKKNWDICQGNSSCYISWISNMFGSALECKSVFRKGRLKGKLVSSIRFERDVKEKIQDKFKVLEEYKTYTNMIIYSNEGTLALLRSNGSYGDLYVGADNDEQVDALGELLQEVSWK